MSNGTTVKKRDGRIESLDLDKMHLMVEEATTGLAGVSASQVEMKSGIQFYDGITTAEIQEILIRAASDLIDLDHPNYQFVAARLLLFALRKQLYGKMRELPHLEAHIMNCTNVDVYDKEADYKEVKREFGINLTDKIKDKYDGILLAVSHKNFSLLDVKSLKKDSKSIIFDLKGFLPRNIVDSRL